MRRAIILATLALLVACGGEAQGATFIPHITTADQVVPDTGPPAHPGYNELLGPGGLYTGVTNYTDCTGRTPLTTYSAALDTCVTGRAYFVGHNPGVFSPILNYHPGDVVTFYNGRGLQDHFTVVGSRDWVWGNGIPPLLPGARVQFQTCLTADGSVDRIVDFR